GIGKQFGMAARCGDIHRPMAGAGDVGLASLLDALERAALTRGHMVGAAGRSDEFLELIVEAFVAKVPLLLRHPFLQPEVRFDLECWHGLRSREDGCFPCSLSRGTSWREAQIEPFMAPRPLRLA